ncbi:PPE family protein [Mycobacterium tuberculosis CAS/NITR204]|uniref:PPE family protein n=1 Tax=Mycobacterium tuberculosis CAS/NITR204 TaxID=1310114 RepID=R4MCI2_MYCTX|nr:PPE family protein [Mycobacterium tuberculosis CAS/NITR204]
MDYAFLPPEINSARMYSGPGPNSMLVAAASWDALAAELASAAENYGSVIARLTGMHWWGPASTSMLAIRGAIVEWLERTAAQTKQTATQARAAAAAFEQAHAMTVPPALVTGHPGCHRRRNGQCQQHRWHSTLTHSVLDQHDTVSAQM